MTIETGVRVSVYADQDYRYKAHAGLLERTVTLYDANGKVIKEWKTDNEIEYRGSVAAFIAKDGTNVRVAGTFVVEGK